MKKILFILLIICTLISCESTGAIKAIHENHGINLISTITVKLSFNPDVTIPAQKLSFFAYNSDYKFYKANDITNQPVIIESNGLAISKIKPDHFIYWIKTYGTIRFPAQQPIHPQYELF